MYGGGASEALMAQAVQGLVEKNGGKEQHAIQSFANALRKLPTIMADNAGLGSLLQMKKNQEKNLLMKYQITVSDSADLVAELRTTHAAGNNTMGLDLYNGNPFKIVQCVKFAPCSMSV